MTEQEQIERMTAAIKQLVVGFGGSCSWLAECYVRNTRMAHGKAVDGQFRAMLKGFGRRAYKQKHGAAPPKLKSSNRRQISSGGSA